MHYRDETFIIIPGVVGGANDHSFARELSVKERTETARLGEHDFDNPLYDEAKQDIQWQTESSYSKLQRPPLQKSFVPSRFPYTMDHNEEASYKLDLAGQGAYDTVNDAQLNHPAYDVAYPPPSNENHGGPYDVTHHPNPLTQDGVPKPSPSALAGGIYNLSNYPEEQTVYDVADHPPQGSARIPRNDYADIADISDTPGPVSSAPQYDYADIADTPGPVSSAPQYDYADIADTPGPVNSAPHYDYADTGSAMSSPSPPASADTEAVQVSRPSVSSSPTYTNTTPGEVTPEAMEHYDLGQWYHTIYVCNIFVKRPLPDIET